MGLQYREWWWMILQQFQWLVFRYFMPLIASTHQILVWVPIDKTDRGLVSFQHWFPANIFSAGNYNVVKLLPVTNKHYWKRKMIRVFNPRQYASISHLLLSSINLLNRPLKHFVHFFCSRLWHRNWWIMLQTISHWPICNASCETQLKLRCVGNSQHLFNYTNHCSDELTLDPLWTEGFPDIHHAIKQGWSM